MYTLSQKTSTFLLSQKLTDFDDFWYVKYWENVMKILQICPPQLSDVATLPGEIQKVIVNSIIHTYFWLFTFSRKKTNCNSLEAINGKTAQLPKLLFWEKRRERFQSDFWLSYRLAYDHLTATWKLAQWLTAAKIFEIQREKNCPNFHNFTR